MPWVRLSVEAYERRTGNWRRVKVMSLRGMLIEKLMRGRDTISLRWWSRGNRRRKRRGVDELCSVEQPATYAEIAQDADDCTRFHLTDKLTPLTIGTVAHWNVQRQDLEVAQSVEDLTLEASTSPCVPFTTTSGICRKSPPRMTLPPKGSEQSIKSWKTLLMIQR